MGKDKEHQSRDRSYRVGFHPKKGADPKQEPFPLLIQRLADHIQKEVARLSEHGEIPRYWIADMLYHLAQAEEAAYRVEAGGEPIGIPKHHCRMA